MIDLDQLVVVALGSNLGDSKSAVTAAMSELQVFSHQPVLKSALWRSVPVDCPPDSPLFINAVAAFAPLPGETPESLLPKLQQLEKRYGRVPKKILNEARPLDLDIILFAREVRQTEALVLPHPRASERRFVLEPLAEIAPQLTYPGDAHTVLELLNRLSPDSTFVRV